MPIRRPENERRVQSVTALAARQGQVVSRRQLYAAGITRWQILMHCRAGRWRRVWDQSVAFHTGPLDVVGQRWAAVFQGGPRACLDGPSALEAAGLERFTVDRIRVSVPRGARVRRTPEFDIRQTRRWRPADVVEIGIPRTRPAVAAVHGFLWARSDKQAVLLLTMAVQQGIVSPETVGAEALQVRRDRRRLLLHVTLNDLLEGGRSLGELDVGRELSRRGLPAPERQVLRRDDKRRYYLDLYWPDYHLVVEVDGIHHAWVENVVSDALRQNALTLADDKVLRLPLLGLRLEPDAFFEQIRIALLRAGWNPSDVIQTAG